MLCYFQGGYIRVFPKIGVPQNGWFIMENPIKMDDLRVPLFLETPRTGKIAWLPKLEWRIYEENSSLLDCHFSEQEPNQKIYRSQSLGGDLQTWSDRETSLEIRWYELVSKQCTRPQNSRKKALKQEGLASINDQLGWYLIAVTPIFGWI